MKTLIFLVLCCRLYQQVNAYPADPSDDVELVPPKNTNTRLNADASSFDDDEEPTGRGEIPVIIIRHRPASSNNNFGFRRPSFVDPSSFFDRDYGFGGGFPFRGFPFSHDDDSAGDDDFFGGVDDERTPSTKTSGEVDDSSLPCGFLCNILRSLEDQVNKLEKDFQAVLSKKKNGTVDNDKEFDVFNETYTERTLSDGSVVKINRTVIADTSDDGNSFFFHSTSFNNHNDDDKTSYDEEEEEVDHEFGNRRPEVSEVPAIGSDEEESSSTTTTSTTTTTTTTTTTESGLVPRVNEDESFNEVLGDVDTKKNESNKGIDDGLVTIEAVQ